MKKIKRILFIINPASGKNEPILNIINDVMHKHEFAWDVKITHRHGDGETYAKEAVASDQYDLIAAYGGDGTVANVASGMIDSDVMLLPLPGGTGNAIIKSFNLPLDLRTNLENMLTYKPIAVDMGRTEQGKAFMLRAVIGIGADITMNTARELKDQVGIFAYTLAGLQQVQNPSKATYRLNLDGESVEAKGIGCVIANTNALGALQLTIHHAVKPDDGKLDVFIIEDVRESLLNLLIDLSWMQDGAAIKFSHWQAKDIQVKCIPEQSVLGDGEYLDELPLSITTIHKAVTMLVPSSENE